MTLLVRLKPLAPKRGVTLHRYSAHGFTFHVDRGWYEVNDMIGEYLRTVRNDSENPESPLAFDVCLQADAKLLQAAEERAKIRQADPDAPLKVHRTHDARAGVLTTGDLPEPPVQKRLASFTHDDEADAADLESEDLAAAVAAVSAATAPPPGSPASRSRAGSRSRPVDATSTEGTNKPE